MESGNANAGLCISSFDPRFPGAKMPVLVDDVLFWLNHELLLSVACFDPGVLLWLAKPVKLRLVLVLFVGKIAALLLNMGWFVL